MKQDRATLLIEIARSIANAQPEFQTVRGPGDGDRATIAFMSELRQHAAAVFGEDCAEKKVCGSTAFAVDFYFAEEATIVEVALGLPNPASEFEKDILKALIAHDYGTEVRRLIFISRPGALKKSRQPGRAAIIAWAKTKHQLSIEVHELGGEPRKRIRRRKPLAEPIPLVVDNLAQ